MQKDNKDDNLRALWDASQPNIDERQIAEALETFRRNRRLHISSNCRKKLFGSILKYAAIIAYGACRLELFGTILCRRQRSCGTVCA